MLDALSEDQALMLEAELIAAFGTIDTGGLLTNAVLPSGLASKARTAIVVPSGVKEKAQIGLTLLKEAVLELAKANPSGITHKNELGQVVHFGSFRKTWQTLGVRFGINQRSAQEILGHSDPNLTAKVYTDVAGLQLHDEIAKLPWLGVDSGCSQIRSQNSGPKGHLVAFPGTSERPAEPSAPVQVVPAESPVHSLSLGDTSQKWWWVMDSNHRRAVPN